MKYYVQRHASGCVGNCFLWWRKGGCGYTCNLDDAEVFDSDDAKFQSIAKDGSKYTAWEKDYIDACAHRHVDHQYVSDPKITWEKEMSEEVGINAFGKSVCEISQKHLFQSKNEAEKMLNKNKDH